MAYDVGERGAEDAALLLLVVPGAAAPPIPVCPVRTLPSRRPRRIRRPRSRRRRGLVGGERGGAGGEAGKRSGERREAPGNETREEATSPERRHDRSFWTERGKRAIDRYVFDEMAK